MTLNSSGPISLGGATVGQSVNLELGFSATATIAMNTTAVRTLAGFPTAGTQYSMSDFYGKSNRAVISYTFTTSTVNASLNVSTIGGYAAGTSDITVTVNSSIYLWANSTGNYGLNLTGATTGDTVTLVNNGYVMGQGGTGAGTNSASATTGGPSLNVGVGVNITVTNTSGYIGGGGGAGGRWAAGSTTGGGGGAGGGNGGGYYDCCGPSCGPGGTGGSIGNGGNSGGSLAGNGGGRIMPGTDQSNQAGGNGGNTGPNGGGAGNAGGSGAPYGGGGGGGYGASGGSGGSTGGAAGGKAVNLNGKTITWTGGSASSSRAYGAVS
jgi:hypothetical protein